MTALGALECGDWRGAIVAASADGADGQAARYLAAGMRAHALGQVLVTWRFLAHAASWCPPPERPRIATQSIDDALPLFPVRHPGFADTFNPDWRSLMLIGHRHEVLLREQRARLRGAVRPDPERARTRGPQAQHEERALRRGAAAKRLALVEAWADHLMLVEFDPWTWQRPTAREGLPRTDQVTRGAFGETGREYFLRRASVLHQSVFPESGGVSRRTWDDLGGYRGVREQAMLALAQAAQRYTPAGGYGRTDALAAAALWSKRRSGETVNEDLGTVKSTEL